MKISFVNQQLYPNQNHLREFTLAFKSACNTHHMREFRAAAFRYFLKAHTAYPTEPDTYPTHRWYGSPANFFLLNEPVLPPRSYRQVLLLAIPIILANLTQPLMSAVDTAVAGHLPGAEHLAGGIKQPSVQPHLLEFRLSAHGHHRRMQYFGSARPDPWC